MRKFLLVFLAVILVSATHAYGFKVMVGGHLSKYAVEPDVAGIEWKNKTAFLIGGGIELFSVPHISLEIEGLYFRKGSKRDEAGAEADYVLDVISVPALVKVKILPGPSPYVMGGGEFSYILTHKLDDVDVKDTTKSFDYGLIFGAGYEMSMPGASLYFEGRYHLGVANILKDPAPGVSIKTKSLVVIVGIKI
ncbi:MAG: outer membrane beta-barrel protein [Candidatus Aminicenantes bacterium]|nr:outer membrane beta-barrel protein [Candidatus Aminicenantes bacterium]